MDRRIALRVLFDSSLSRTDAPLHRGNENREFERLLDEAFDMCLGWQVSKTEARVPTGVGAASLWRDPRRGPRGPGAALGREWLTVGDAPPRLFGVLRATRLRADGLRLGGEPLDERRGSSMAARLRAVRSSRRCSQSTSAMRASRFSEALRGRHSSGEVSVAHTAAHSSSSTSSRSSLWPSSTRSDTGGPWRQCDDAERQWLPGHRRRHRRAGCGRALTRSRTCSRLICVGISTSSLMRRTYGR